MTFLLDHDSPDDLAYSLHALGHQCIYLRNILPRTASDLEILELAHQKKYIVITCNYDDFLALGKSKPHCGIIILKRRETRASERSALVHLLDRLGESSIVDNINFA